jgi:hypothetical protein
MVKARNFKGIIIIFLDKGRHSKVYLRLIFVGNVRHFNGSC